MSSMRKNEANLVESSGQEPPCWNYSGGQQRELVTILEAAKSCGVSVNAVYMWMDKRRTEWLYNAGGKRRIYRDSLPRRKDDTVSSPVHS